EFEPARTLADSLLSAHDGPPEALPAGMADRLAGLAAFTGRIERAAQLRARADGESNASRGIAPPLGLASARLLERAAAGVCDDSIATLAQSIDVLLESYSQPNHRGAMRAEAMERPLSLAFPCVRA